MRVERLDFKPKGLAEGDEGVEVAGTVAPKPVVVANHDRHGFDAVGQQGLGVFPRREVGQVFCERMQHQVVEPGVGQQFTPLLQGVQKFQPVVVGVQHHTRMGGEAEEGGGGVVAVRNLPQLLKHGPMACMDAVEGAHRQHGPWLSTGVAGKL